MMVMQYLISPDPPIPARGVRPAYKIEQAKQNTTSSSDSFKTICDRTAVLGLDLSKVAIVLKSSSNHFTSK